MSRLNDLKEERKKLGVRQRRMIQELRDIFPIVEFNNKYSICEILLPDSNNLKAHDDTQVSVAISYVTQILIQLSEILDLTPRFPIIFQGSKSSIVCTRRCKTFPLHLDSSKGRENFDNGLALLNLNLLQIRTLCGLPTEQPDYTLKNLFGLLNDIQFM